MNLLPQSTLDRLKLSRFPFKRAKDGSRLGNHNSPFTGASAEFAQHREYCPGDEPRRIDWRVLARTERFVIKQFSQETNLRATIVLDTSASMNYGGSKATKIYRTSVKKMQHAAGIAAALAWVLIRQGDSVGMMAYDQQVHLRTPHAATSGHLHRLIHVLNSLTPKHQSDTSSGLHRIARTLPSRGLIILCSDLFDDPNKIREALHHLRYRNHEIVVIQIMAKDEMDFQFDDSIRFRDLEWPDSQYDVEPTAIRKEYLRLLNEHLAKIREACAQVQADYLLTTTDQSIPDVVATFLARRCDKGAVTEIATGVDR